MKVLIINSVCGFGSTGKICTDIADALIKNGDDCMIAYGRGNAPERYQSITYRITSRLGCLINATKARLLDNEGFNSEACTKRLIGKISEFDPDIVHIHNLHGYYIHTGILLNYLKRSRCRVVWTLHDCWSFTGHCAHFPDCDKWQTHCYKCAHSRSYPKSLFLDRSYSNFEKKRSLTANFPYTVVTPSQWLADLVGESFLQDHPCSVIRNGIDDSVFCKRKSEFRKEYNLEHKKIILGVSSVWTSSKGLDDFIGLSELLDDRYQIVLVGLTPNQIKQLPNKILGLERTDSVERLAQIYSEADVFFNPTYFDTYPTVNLEAQACGTPVVTYRTGGSVESVPSENVIDVGNFRGILPLLDRELAIKNMDYRKQSMINSYLALYRELTTS